MKVIHGDLLELADNGEFDVICHGANCFHTWGAGIALQIRKKWQQAYISDCKNSTHGDPFKLGSFTTCTVKNKMGKRLIIINAYTQFDLRQVEYGAIVQVFQKIRRAFTDYERIGYPRIGAGLAGGDWEVISEIIDRQLAGMDHTLVEYGG